jgi:hypothetical protein
MRRSRRLAIAGFTTAAVAATLGAVVVNGPSASAQLFGTFVTANNSSDPHIINCTRTDGVVGYCLYTSQDLGQDYAYAKANYYPMTETMVYFSTNGYSGWSAAQIAFKETQIPWVPRRTGTGKTANDHDSCVGSGHASGGHMPFHPDFPGNCRAYHLWAPTAFKAAANDYWLFVPDVTNTSYGPSAVDIHTSSRIAVARSSNPLAAQFTYNGFVTDSSGNVPGYMSDPDVVADGLSRYLFWADGDYATCGGFKSGAFEPSSGMTKVFTNTIKTVDITGLDHAKAGLGVCVKNRPGMPDHGQVVQRPYLEGASFYKEEFKPGKPWTLIFPAKPGKDPANLGGADVIPKECNSSNASPGSAQNANSVVAWASATQPQGPYTYEGVLMCGSLHEWTNQATVTITPSPNKRLMMIYHDAADGSKNRKLQAECLYYGGGHLHGAYRQALDSSVPNGFSACVNGTEDANYKALWAWDPQQPTKAPLLSVDGGGEGEIIAKRYAVGPWERFKFEVVATGTYVIRALSNGRLLCPPADSTLPVTSTPLRPRCTSSNDPRARFMFEQISGEPHFRLRAVWNNLWVGIAANGRAYISSTTTGDAAKFAQLGYVPPSSWGSSLIG